MAPHVTLRRQGHRDRSENHRQQCRQTQEALGALGDWPGSRVLLTGQDQTPSVDALVALFPREEVLRRLAAAG